MFCNKCGKEMNEQEKFCSQCGNGIENNVNNSLNNSNISIGNKKHLIYSLICLAIIVVGFFTYIYFLENPIDNSIQVPNLTGKTIEEAQEEMKKLGLKLEIDGIQTDNSIIVSTDTISSKVKKGSIIRVTVGSQQELENKENQKKYNANRQNAITSAKSAVIKYANYDPSFGDSKVLEIDNYGRYLVEIVATLYNGFGAGKTDTYYVVVYDVTSERYKCNQANGVIQKSTYTSLESVKKLNNWNEELK